ncbi:MAG: hypothetical protein RLZZ545_673 [Actinomycetota bacterium]|jgi:hypothetical protein
MTVKALDRVRNAHMMGAVTRKELRVITGLDADIVDLCVDLMISSGEIKPTELKGACTVGGCNSCGEDSTCHPRENHAGPVTLNISKRPGI